MPPRSRGGERGRGRKAPYNGPDLSTEEVFDIISIGSDSDSSSVIMTGQRRVARGQQYNRKSKLGKTSHSAVPQVYQDMLTEALASSSRDGERETPRKRRKLRKPGEQDITREGDGDIEENEEDEEEVFPQDLDQSIYDSDDGSEDDVDWEEVGMASNTLDLEEEDDQDLTLHLHASPIQPKGKDKRTTRVFSKAERSFHLEIHKLHILCLLRHVDIRNDWCNDEEVQKIVTSLVGDRMRKLVNPQEDWSQFRRTESLKSGLEQLGALWERNFKITARGMRRSFWASDEQELNDFKLPTDFDPPLDRKDFTNAASKLQGSRDVGTQLYCALLRGLGVEARLVCSLQPLPLLASTKGFPPRPGDSSPAVEATTPESSEDIELVDVQSLAPASVIEQNSSNLSMPFAARRRLGHPNAADYHMPDFQPSMPTSAPKPKPKRRRIYESPYPVFWIEVLDEAHQKWMPVDPLATHTVNKPKIFEPPAADIGNNMHYVIAFESEGTARDVTRRYTRWLLAKTRRNRVESTDGGEKWLRRTLRFYSRGWTSDLEQIEDIELAAAEAREGMPTSLADFKDHPRYVLERDLRRNEILVHRHEVGKVAAGRDPNSPGGKKLESVFRRSDVRIVKSADAWYRMGRDIKMGEQPMKTRPAATKKRPQVADQDDSEDEMDTQLYSLEQTELYEPPPVVNGRVPRNRYGNIDVYVPSMVPKGGVHILYSESAHAADLLRVDYASAVTGFQFKGRNGRPVLKGIVVAEEYQAAVEAVVDGIRDEIARAEEDLRAEEAVETWRKFLIGLRVKARVDTYQIEGENPAERAEEEIGRDTKKEKGKFIQTDENDEGGGFIPDLKEEFTREDVDMGQQEEGDSGMESEEYFDDGGGGFIPDDEE